MGWSQLVQLALLTAQPATCSTFLHQSPFKPPVNTADNLKTNIKFSFNLRQMQTCLFLYTLTAWRLLILPLPPPEHVLLLGGGRGEGGHGG